MEYNFREGYKRGIDISANELGMDYAIDFDQLNKHIETYEKMSDNLSNIMRQRINGNDNSIRGFLYEEFQAGTFNFDSIKNNSPYYAMVKNNNDKINDLEIFDTRTGEVIKFFQLKNAKLSTIKEAIRKHPGYAQTDGVIVNSEVFNKLYESLQKKSDNEIYKVILEKLDTKVCIEDDTYFISGWPINREDMGKMVQDMREQTNKNGSIDLELSKYIDFEKYYSNQLIFNKSLEAGLNAALISFISNFVPIILSEMSNGKRLSNDELLKECLSAGGKSFIRGALTSSLVLLCNSGRLGSQYLNTKPEFIGGTVIIAMNTMINVIKVSKGDLSWSKCIDDLVRDIIVITMSYWGKIMGSILLKEVALIGSLLGSFIGAFVGNVVYNAYDKIIISFSIRTGFNLFGLVTNDYKLPDEILKEKGFDLIISEYQKFENVKLEFNEYEDIQLEYNDYDHIKLDFNLLKRGLIAFNTIGYC